MLHPTVEAALPPVLHNDRFVRTLKRKPNNTARIKAIQAAIETRHALGLDLDDAGFRPRYVLAVQYGVVVVTDVR